MRSEDIYKERPDDFSRKVGEKLREHRLPVDPGQWDSLNDRLPRRGRRIPAYWPWAVAGVAAVAAVLLVLQLLPDPSSDEQAVDVVQNIQQEQQAQQVQQERQDQREQQVHQEQREQQAQQEHQTQQARQEQMAQQAQQAQKEQQTQQAQQVELDQQAQSLEEAIQKADVLDVLSETIDKPIEEEIAVQVEKPVTGNVVEHQPHSFVLALGSGGALSDLIPIGHYGDELMYDSPVPGGDYTEHDGSGTQHDLLTPNDYTDIEHRLPVSFSLMTGFPVKNGLTVETGLSYTYLFSRFGRNDHFTYRGTLQQHYVGIPVNLKYAVWRNDAWSIYLWGGGSVEKGLRSVYKQEIEQNGGLVYHTRVSNRIRGFQFSAQGGAGFSYRLGNNLNLFGEPRLIYYFKNNQPMSARTEDPLIFGLNLGIRIEFNSNQ